MWDLLDLQGADDNEMTIKDRTLWSSTLEE